MPASWRTRQRLTHTLHLDIPADSHAASGGELPTTGDRTIIRMSFLKLIPRRTDGAWTAGFPGAKVPIIMAATGDSLSASPENLVAGGTASPTADAGRTDLSGRTLGEFKLLRKLGRGGMAEVYLAEQTTLRRNVAVKVLRPEFTTDAAYLKRFRQEATAAGTLNHPNIVQVYLIGEQDGIQFIAQEYVHGRNLKEYLARKGPLDLPIALMILRQVAAALQAAGAAGIVHRDIKPENILLTGKGEAKVADFGLAQLTLQGEKVALTQVGITMGTPLYMSPEQVNGKLVDARSDLYSFGVMAYHMLAGKPPFQGETPLAVAVQHLNAERPSLKAVRPDLPDAVCNFVMKLMAKKREDRYPDAAAVVQELKQLSRIASGKEPLEEAIPLTPAKPAKPPSGKHVIWDRPLSRQLMWLIPLCLTAAASAAAAGWALRTKDPFATPPKQQTGVQRYETPQAQYYHALLTPGDPAGWQAILDYHQTTGKVCLECDRAELHLAMIDLRNNRLDKAFERFSRMELEGSSNPWKKAHGLAGLAVIDSLQGRPEDSRRRLEQVRNMAVHLDTVMDDALEEAKRRNARS
jgi:serine/threonine-protein kinase